MALKTGVIGCGNMGGGMVRRLLKEDLPVICYDPSKDVLEALNRLGCSISDDAESLAANVDIVILSLPTAAVVEQVMACIHTHITPGTIVLDTSTSKPATSKYLSKLAHERAYYFLDAPVSGGPIAANAGTMTMLIGGESAALTIARPVLEHITARIVEVGSSGSGHAAKIANNMLCAANLVLVGEAIRMAQAAGVTADELLEGINAGSGRSGVSEVNYPRWILNGKYDSGFTMGLMRKDVKLALELAKQGDVQLRGFEGIAELWDESTDTLPDSEDFNKIFERGEVTQ